MNVTMSKSEYKKIQKDHDYLLTQFFALRKFVEMAIDDEVTAATEKRLLARSRKMDTGHGIHLNSIKEVRAYLKNIS